MTYSQTKILLAQAAVCLILNSIPMFKYSKPKRQYGLCSNYMLYAQTQILFVQPKQAAIRSADQG